MVGFITGKIAVVALAAVALLLDMADVSIRGLPLSALLLSALLGYFVCFRRDRLWTPCWLRIAFLSSLCLGIVPLAGMQIGEGARELVQAFAVFGIAWTVFGALTDAEREDWHTLLGLFWVGLAALSLAPIRFPVSDARMSLLLCLLLPFAMSMALKSHKFGPLLLLLLLGVFVAASRNSPLMLTGFMASGVLLLMRRSKVSVSHWVSFMAVLALALGLLGTARKSSLSWQHTKGGTPKRLLIECEALPSAVMASPVVGHGLGQYREKIGRYFKRFPDSDDNRISPDTNSIYAVLAFEAGLPACLLLLIMLVGTTWGEARGGSKAAPELVVAAASIVLAGLFTVPVTRNTGVLVGSILGMTASRMESPIQHGLKFTLRRWLVLVASVLICTGVGALQNKNKNSSSLAVMKPARLPGSEFVVIEAENTLGAPTGPLAVIKANDASGNLVLSIPLGAEKGKGASVYAVPELPHGEYTLWSRVLWHDGCANSIGCIVDQQQIVISDEIFKRWHWVPTLKTIKLGGSGKRLRLCNREDGVMIDQLVLTRDADFVPYGIVKQPAPGR